MGRFRMTAAAFALVLVAAFALAEAWRPPAPPAGVVEVALASSLKSFSDCGEFLDTVRGEAEQQLTPYGLGGGAFHDEFSGGLGAVALREEAAFDAGVTAGGAPQMAADGAAAGGSEGVEYSAPPAPADSVVEVSGTNVQERGVDEPDVVKTDGRVLAAVARGRLQLVDLAGPGRVAATVALADGWGHELLLHGDRLLVTATVHEVMAEGATGTDQRRAAEIAIAPMGAPKVELLLLDVSEPASPRTLGSVRLDGELVSSRLVDGVVRVVLRSHPQPPMAHPQPGAQTDPAEMRDLESLALERNREIVASSQAADWLPSYRVADAGGDTIGQAPLVECTDVRYPEQFRGLGMVSVLALDLDGDGASALTPTGTASVLGGGDTVYATPERLYVAMNQWEHEGGPQPLIDPPMGAPMPVEPDGGIGDTPEDASGDAPVPAPVPAPQPPETTVEIHEFDTSDPRRPLYTASGSVPGHLLNQWALSFHEGHLRIATTDGMAGFEGQTSESAVHVLRRDGDKLVEVGRAGGLGKGERIYAVRYFGDFGFVVTFRQTDPLYTLDLSDPARPRVLGELKVPGFSSYLHPVGDGLLLGVGQDADEATGRTRGLQVSLFDVSDLSDPRRVANLTMEPESSSDVQHEHRAFLWWPAARRAVLPYMHARWDEGAQRETGFFGALAVDVDGDVREAGRISHSQGDSPDPWWSMIRRAVVVGDVLYTVSERGLMASDLESLAARGFVEFDGPTPQQFVEEGVVQPDIGLVDPAVAPEPRPID